MAVDDQGYIVVADSGNNRIQVFTADGVFVKAFGCWGSGDGEFKVNVKSDPVLKMPYHIRHDRVSCTVQLMLKPVFFLFLILSSSNRRRLSFDGFEKSIQGLEGIAVMSNGNIVCADRENHRIQVF